MATGACPVGTAQRLLVEGKPPTLAAGVVIGLVEVLVGLAAPAFKYVGVFCLYLAVVLWRPQGLFGRF